MEYSGEEKMEISTEEENNTPFDLEEDKMDYHTGYAHAHFAGRIPAGANLAICVSKHGVQHVSS